MRRLSRDEIRMNRTASALCAILFIVFSFSFLAFFQGDLLAAAQDVLSHGTRQAIPYLSAAIITLLLFLLKLFYNRLARLHSYWEAIAYIPSCLMLAFITDIDRSLFYDWHIPHYWMWVLPVVLAVCLVIVWFYRQLLSPIVKSFSTSVYEMLWRNMLIMALLFTGTALLSNTNENFHNELSVARAIQKGDYEGALGVGKNSLSASRELTVLRAVAMSQSGTMGERLFEYPQHYGADGLLLPPLAVRTTLLNDSDFVAIFGIRPYNNETAVAFFERASSLGGDSLPYLYDYYLSALLLDKQLQRFADELPHHYDTAKPLPKHYAEAMMLLVQNDSLSQYTDNPIRGRYRQFDSLQHVAYENDVVKDNTLRRGFGNSYWWYMQHGKE